MKRLLVSLVAPAVILVCVTGRAKADIIVYTGYDDGTGFNGSPVPPNPWYGSANTTFYGSASDISLAQTSDPDISAVRILNTNASSITISDVSLSAEDLFTRAGLSSPVTLGPGQNAIFAVGDGSDLGLVNQTVTGTIDGSPFSFKDVDLSVAPDGVLFGNNPFVNGVETVPWTQIGDVSPSTAVPEPASLALLGQGAAALLGLGWRNRRKLLAFAA